MLFSQEGEDRSERSLGSGTARDTGPLTHTAGDREHPERVAVYGPAFSKKARERENQAWLWDVP